MRVLPIIFCYFITHATLVLAEPRGSDLSAGLSRFDVLTMWGGANDKVEKEIKREEVWSYGPLTLFFKEGVLARWEESGVVEYQQAQLSIPASSDHVPLALGVNEGSQESQILLNELLNQFPDESSSGSAPGDPAMPGSPLVPPAPMIE